VEGKNQKLLFLAIWIIRKNLIILFFQTFHKNPSRFIRKWKKHFFCDVTKVEIFYKQCLTFSKKNQISPFKYFSFGRFKCPVKGLKHSTFMHNKNLPFSHDSTLHCFDLLTLFRFDTNWKKKELNRKTKKFESKISGVFFWKRTIISQQFYYYFSFFPF
jgi:hypothetical protein